MSLRIRLAGPIDLCDGPYQLNERALAGRQGRLLFARLALAGGPVYRDELAEILWPDQLPATWERTLSTVVSRLRSALTSGLQGVTIGNAFGNYELKSDSEVEVDLHIAIRDAECSADAVARDDRVEATARADAALATLRRPFLAGEDGPWIEEVRTAIRVSLVRALLARAQAGLGTHEAVAAAAEACRVDPYNEAAHVLLMRSHAALGNRADAVRAYETCRALLESDLDTDPSPETQAAYLVVLRDTSGHEVERNLSIGSGVSRPQTNFIGRGSELAAAASMVQTRRLVTLTGPGGVGKTRLGLEISALCAPSFEDGVFVVDLAAFAPPMSLVEHVAAAIGMQAPTGGLVETLASSLSEQRTLILLDNCEHVIQLCSAFVRELLDRSRRPVVLATSRERLGVPGEAVISLQPLRVPGDDATPKAVSRADAVALFCDRLAVVRPGFVLTAANAAKVGSICRRLDGLPLAVELAAARGAAMSVTEIDEQLDVLAPGDGTRSRVRTLTGTIDWSYDSLGARDALGFRSCSVFEGAFTASTAEAVCGYNVQDTLAGLVRMSLLSENAGRYRFLQIIKTYGRARAKGSSEWNATATRHAEHFCTLVPELASTHDQAGFLAAFAEVRADARAALEHALACGLGTQAASLAIAAARFWIGRGYFVEARDVLQRTLVLINPAVHPDQTAQLLGALGRIVHNQGELDLADDLWTRALAIATEARLDATRAVLLADFASNAQARGNLAEAITFAESALDLARAAGAHLAEGRALMTLFVTGHGSRPAAELTSIAVEAFDAFARAGNQSGMARALVLQAMVGWPEDPAPGWRETLLRSVGLCRDIGDRLTEGMVLLQLGAAVAQSGDVGGALPILGEALGVCRRIGYVRGTLSCIEHIGLALARDGSAELAVSLVAASERHQVAAGLPPSETDVEQRDALVTAARERAGLNADAAEERGRSLTVDDAISLALTATR